MSTRDGFPLVREWKVNSRLTTVIPSIQNTLLREGFKPSDSDHAPAGIEYTGSPVPEAESFHVQGCAPLRADVQRRLQGKLLLGLGIALTLVTFVLLAWQISTERAVVSPILLLAVVFGGWGLGKLKEPSGLKLRAMDFIAEAAPGDTATSVTLTVGIVAMASDGFSTAWTDNPLWADDAKIAEIIKEITEGAIAQ